MHSLLPAELACSRYRLCCFELEVHRHAISTKAEKHTLTKTENTTGTPAHHKTNGHKCKCKYLLTRLRRNTSSPIGKITRSNTAITIKLSRSFLGNNLCSFVNSLPTADLETEQSLWSYHQYSNHNRSVKPLPSNLS